MADDSLRASFDDAVSLTIPAQYVERFRDEAVFTLAAAADNIQEAGGWMRKARHDPSVARTITPAELVTFAAAQAVFTQVFIQANIGDPDWVLPEDGDLTIDGSRATLGSTVRGCLLEVADVLKGEAEKVDADLSGVVNEFEFWRSLREQLDGAEATEEKE